MTKSESTAPATRPRTAVLPGLTAGALAVSAVAIVAIAALSWQAAGTRATAEFWVTHTFEVVARLEGLLSRAKDAETGQRGYLLTGDEKYLEPHDEAVRSFPGEFAELKRLLADNPAQLRCLDEIEQTQAAKLAELKQTIDLRRAGNGENALKIVHTDVGKHLMEKVRAEVAQMIESEHGLLRARETESGRAEAATITITLGGSALVLALLVVLGVVASRDFRAREVEAWLQSAQAHLIGRMQGDAPLEQLGNRILEGLASLLGAKVAALYVVEPDRSLRRLAAYALGPEPAAATIRPGEGLAGQAFLDNKVVVAGGFPKGALKVQTTFGAAEPRQVIAAPAHVDDVPNAVIELGLEADATPIDLELIERTVRSIGLAIRVAQDRFRLQSLLEETQRQTEELQSQQNELETQRAELEATNADVNQTNALMEIQTQELQQQRDSLAEAREAADRASRYKSEFLANMSHELRTPLNSALILAKILADNKEGNLSPDQIKSAETIYAAGNDLLLLINDILDLSKIEAGHAEIVTEPVTVAQVASSLERSFRPVAKQKGVGFKITRRDGSPERLATDVRRLEQVLKNLLSNAFKFTARGEVELTVAAEGADRIRFAVRDTGIGIKPEQHDVIFEAFRQADGTTSRKYGGTGLGLSISRELVQLLGGELTVESEVGKGSTFNLVLPLDGPPAASAVTDESRPQRPAAAKARTAQAALKALKATGSGAASANAQRIAATASSGGVSTSAATAEGRTSAGSGAAPSPFFADDRDQLKRVGRLILAIEDDGAFAKILYDLAHELDFDCVVAATAEDGLRLARHLLPSGILLDVGLPDASGLSVLEQLKRDPLTRPIPIHMVSVSDNVQTALELGAIGYALKPVARDQLASAMKKLDERRSRETRRVLVVEDDVRQQESLTKLLGGQGVELVLAGTVKETLAHLEARNFDCMVLDLTLPDGSGYDLLEKMVAGSRYSFPPVIVYTGRELAREDEERLRRYSRSIIVKGARSPERLLDEVTLFLHQVESTLPAEQRRMLADARQREAVFEGRRILVVEDDVRNIFALSKILEPRGAKVEIARNGKEALAFFDAQPAVDLVLMDIMMPEMDGLTAMRELRKRPALKRLPVIALTAKAMADDREQAIAAGASDYMAKPIDVDKLLSLCRVWMPRA